MANTSAEIRTDRLILRPLARADARRIGMLSRDRDVARMVTQMPYPQTDIGAEGFILIMEARARLGNDHVYAIDLPGEGPIGVCGAHGHGEAGVEVGYWLGRPFWGKGFATEAARAVTSVARGLDRGPVTAGHFVDNPASGRVLEKVGFVYTGEIAPRFSLARAARVDTRVMHLGGTERV
jgi:RimJ/RimL family protein N-acetyltransferase